MGSSAALTGHAGEGAASVALPADFERLFRAEYQRVAAIAFRVLWDRDEAEDVAQDVFLSFHRRHRADAPYAAPWLHAAAAHLALNAARGRRRRARRELVVAGEPGPDIDPEEGAIAGEERSAVREVLARLPEGTASLLVLRHSGLSYAELAVALDIPADQVGTRLRRAHQTFKKEVLRGRSRP